MDNVDFSQLSNRFNRGRMSRMSLREFTDKALNDSSFEGFLGNLRDGAVKDPDSLRNFKKELATNDRPDNWISVNLVRKTFGKKMNENNQA